MKKPLLIFAILFILLEIVTPLGAINQPNVDDIELMLKKIENNLKSASQVTSLAKANGEKLVETKVQEKNELKQSVQALSEKVEIFAVKMTEAGIDTSVNTDKSDDFHYEGPLYEEWLEYQKNGGESDFEYYRLYKK